MASGPSTNALTWLPDRFHFRELELAVISFGANAQHEQRAHQPVQGALVHIGKLRQLSAGARTLGEQIGDAELGRHVDDGCHTIPGDQVDQVISGSL